MQLWCNPQVRHLDYDVLVLEIVFFGYLLSY